MGVTSAFNRTPTTYPVSVGCVGAAFSAIKAGASLSVTSTVLQKTFKKPNN